MGGWVADHCAARRAEKGWALVTRQTMVDALVLVLHDLLEELALVLPGRRVAGEHLGVRTDLVRARGDDEHAPQPS